MIVQDVILMGSPVLIVVVDRLMSAPEVPADISATQVEPEVDNLNHVTAVPAPAPARPVVA